MGAGIEPTRGRRSKAKSRTPGGSSLHRGKKKYSGARAMKEGTQSHRGGLGQRRE